MSNYMYISLNSLAHATLFDLRDKFLRIAWMRVRAIDRNKSDNYTTTRDEVYLLLGHAKEIQDYLDTTIVVVDPPDLTAPFDK